MSVSCIKEIYGKEEIQSDLTLDSLVLFAKNITNNYFNFNKRTITKDDIDKLVDFFGNELYKYNEIEIEWDQTS